ncbi:MAG: hypothetical protein K2Y25_00740 [Pseudomonadaceae bacterium]|nr:hypothetical protein [Pseudomonadaceae bacterium]
MPYVLAIFVLLLLTAGALGTIPFLAVIPILLIGWLVKAAPVDAIENFYAYCGAAALLVGAITLVQQFI